MKYFEIYRHPSESLTACKLGWSWPGFFFTFVWAFIHRQYFSGLITIAAAALAFLIWEYAYVIWWLIISGYFALGANSLKRHRLMKQGYTHMATIGAANQAEAVAKFVKSVEAQLESPKPL